MTSARRGFKRMPKLAQQAFGAPITHQLYGEGHARAAAMSTVCQSAWQRNCWMARVVKRNSESPVWPWREWAIWPVDNIW